MVHYKIYAVDNQHKLGKDKIDEETARGQTFYWYPLMRSTSK